jgi:hypothetical protein
MGSVQFLPELHNAHEPRVLAADEDVRGPGGSWEAPLALRPCIVPWNRGWPRGVQSSEFKVQSRGGWEASSSSRNCTMPINQGAGVRSIGFGRSVRRPDFGRCPGRLKPALRTRGGSGKDPQSYECSRI